MRRIGVVFLAVSIMVGCGSAPPAPDPNNGVSDASYRDALEKSQVNFEQLGAAFGDLKAKDASRGTSAMFPASFWDAEILLAKRGEKLCAATLQGNVSAPTPAPSPADSPVPK